MFKWFWTIFSLGAPECLVVEIDEFLAWDSHITFVPTSNLISVYQSIVESYLGYCSIVWDDISDRLTDKLQKLQNRAARIITGADYLTPTTELLSRLGWTNLKKRRNKQKTLMMFKNFNGMTLAYLEGIFSSNIGRSIFNLRTSRWNLSSPAVKTNY